jgi:hypothetical protein
MENESSLCCPIATFHLQCACLWRRGALRQPRRRRLPAYGAGVGPLGACHDGELAGLDQGLFEEGVARSGDAISRGLRD